MKETKILKQDTSKGVPFPKDEWICRTCDANTNKTIVITVRGGCVVDVVNMPDDWDYALVDYDVPA